MKLSELLLAQPACGYDIEIAGITVIPAVS